MAQDTQIPVIIGVGEINDRPAPGEDGLDSVGLMAAAARAADADAGGGWLAHSDWVAITPQISFRELDVPTLLPQALGIAPARVAQAPSADGDSPVRHLNDAANAIASGEASVCLVVGGEAVRTAARRDASSGGRGLFKGSMASASELRRRYGLITPTDIYPLYENACRPEWNQSLIEGQAETGEIWSRFSQVAASADGAWLKKPRTPDEIIEVTADNRPIAFPYTKLTVANSSVNQGAALIVTSLALARAAGIPDERIVYFGAGASAHEDNDPLERAHWTGSPAMRVALETAMQLNGLEAGDLDHVELYSCFPCVPKMARRVLRLSADRPLTVHGGLTFGGGPIGNYMSHAAAAMVRALRAGGRYGLLFGNGGHCTHNHALVLSSQPVAGVSLPQNYHYQGVADASRDAIPELTDAHEGPVTLETYTVVYGREGTPEYGITLSLNAAGQRVVARVPAEDTATIAFLTDGAQEPVGIAGETLHEGEMLIWRRAATG